MKQSLYQRSILTMVGNFEDRQEADVFHFRYLMRRLERMLHSYPHSNFKLTDTDIYLLKFKIFEIASEVQNEITSSFEERSETGFILKIFFSHVENPPIVGICIIDEVYGNRNTITGSWVISMYQKYLKELELKELTEIEPYDFDTTY